MALMTAEVAVGETFAGKPRAITWERLWAFSGGAFAAEGWPRKNIHTDLEAAKAAGVARVAASGTQYQGYLVGLLLDMFGEGWLSSGTLEVKLPEVVGVGDTITPKATVVSTSATRRGLSVHLDVWCENQTGLKVLAGSATGILPERATG